MKVTIFALSLLLLFGLSVHGQVQVSTAPPPAPARDYFPEKWQEYTYSEYGFSVKAPGPLKKTIELAESNADGVRWVKFSAGSDSFISYSVNIKELSTSPTENESMSRLFDEAMDARVRKYGDQKAPIKKDILDRSGLPARQYEFAATGRRIRDMVVIRGRLLYIAEVNTSDKDGAASLRSKDAYKEIADAFLNSFGFPPPPTLVGSLPTIDEGDESVWKEFVADNDGFRNQWPGAPTERSTEIRTATRIIPQTEYFVRGSLVTFDAVVQTYSIGYDDKAGLDSLFDGWKRGHLKIPGASVTSEKSISGLGTTVHELKIESESAVVTTRAFFVRGRFYTFSAIYQKIYEPLPKIKKAIDASIDKFFSSVDLFSPKALRDAEAEDLKLPDGFFGETSGGRYKNVYFEFEITIPDSWIVASSEDNKMILQYAKDAMAAQNAALMNRLKSPEKTILNATKKPMGAAGNASLMVDTIRENTTNINLELTAKKNEAIYGQLANSRISKPTQLTKVGGRNFYLFERELSQRATIVRQRIAMTLHNNYVIYFILTYVDDADGTVLDSALKGIRFKK